MAEETYYVTFHEPHVVVERVVATSKTDAIRRVKSGEGERTSEMVDENHSPTGHTATTEAY